MTSRDLISISDDCLKKHVDYSKLIQLCPFPGSAVVGEMADSYGFGEIGNDRRWYFVTPEDRIKKIKEYFLNKNSLVDKIIIGRFLLVNLPENLREAGEKIEKLLNPEGA